MHDMDPQSSGFGAATCDAHMSSIDIAYIPNFDQGVSQYLLQGNFQVHTCKASRSYIKVTQANVAKNGQPSAVDYKSQVVANIHTILGDKKVSLLSAKLTRPHADIVDYMVKVEVVREALRVPVTYAQP